MDEEEHQRMADTQQYKLYQNATINVHGNKKNTNRTKLCTKLFLQTRIRVYPNTVKQNRN